MADQTKTSSPFFQMSSVGRSSESKNKKKKGKKEKDVKKKIRCFRRLVIKWRVGHAIWMMVKMMMMIIMTNTYH